jgi:hypothetical protein
MQKVTKKTPMENFWQRFLFRSWWVLLFLLFGIITYNQAIKKKKEEIASLEYRIHEVQKAKEISIAHQEDLLLRIRSQSDPDWIELVLMKELGVVPEGSLKVHFAPKKDGASSSQD